MIRSFVTIGIPAYKNVFLKEAIDSALAQDYNNIEVVIVNDASPYDIDSIVNSYHDERIRYYKNEKNLGRKGIARNWNKCLEYAKGGYFVLLCDDDLLKPNFVSTLVQLADLYPDCNVFHATRSILNMSTGKEEKESVWKNLETHEEYVESFFSGRKHSVTEFMFRTAHIKSLMYQDFPVGYYSDNASIMLFSKGGFIASSPMTLAVFRQSGNHITSNLRLNPQKAKAAKLFIRWIRDNQICSDSYQIYKRKLEYESLTYLFGAQSWRKFMVLPYLPVSFVTIKSVLFHFANLLRKKILKRVV